MAQKISVLIALEGGKEVERQFAALGEQGKKAFNDIDQAAKQVGGFRNLDPEVMTQKLKTMGVTGVQSINNIQQAVQRAGQLEGIAETAAKLEAGANKATAAFGLTRREINGIRTALRQIDLGPLGSQLGALARVGAAFKGPGIALAAMGGGITALVKLTTSFAESITKAADEAAKLGIPFAQFDRLRATMEAAGVPAENISKAIENIAKATEQADLDKVTKSIKELQDAAKRGFGPIGTQQLENLEKAASGIGPAADKAREALKEMGMAPAPGLQKLVDQLGKVQGLTAFLGQVQMGGAPASLKEFIAAFGQTQGFQAFLQQLAAMPDIVQRNKLAMDQLGISGDKLNKVLERTRSGKPLTGLISDDDVQKANALSVALETLQTTLGRLRSVGLAPGMTTTVNAATTAVETLDQAIAKTSPEWGVLGLVAKVAISPIAAMLELITTALSKTDQALAKTGETATQTGQKVTQAGQQTAQAGQQTAQAGEQGESVWQRIPPAVNASIDMVAKFASSLAGIAWDAISGVGVSAWDALTGAIGRAIDAVLRFIGLKPSAPAAGDAGASGNARGGLLGGRGSGTSDSNLAWVSRGEYITPARAVRQPGVLALLEALRRSGGNLSRVLDGMGRFALGGMVPRTMPAFASGGLAGGMSNVTIQFPGLPAIGGLRAPAAVVDELRKAAAMAQVRSGGRKPSRYS